MRVKSHQTRSFSFLQKLSTALATPGSFCLLSNKSNIAIQSNSTIHYAKVECSGSHDEPIQTGFGFFNVSSLTIKNVHFENCGGVVTEEALRVAIPPSSDYYAKDQQAVILLNHCRDVCFENMTVTHYRGFGIVGLNIHGFSVLTAIIITNSFMSQNISRNTTTFKYSGSGAYFLYLDTEFPDLLTISNTLEIRESTFTFNTNRYPPSFEQAILTMAAMRLYMRRAMLGAGGLSVTFNQLHFNVNITVSHSNISYNSGSTGGGGTLVINVDTLGHSLVKFDHCTFENNINTGPIPGGAIQIAFFFGIEQTFTVASNWSENNVIDAVQFSDIVVENNAAATAGGVAIYSSAQNVANIAIRMNKVKFTNNVASGNGDCLFARVERSVLFSQRNLVIDMRDITANSGGGKRKVEGNEVFSDSPFNGFEVASAGPFYFVNLGAVSISGRSVFENGIRSCITAYATNIHLTESVTFRNFTAVDGAAMRLETGSHLFVTEPADIHFYNCTALHRGGAISSKANVGTQCAIQFFTGTHQFLTRKPQPIATLEGLNDLNILLTFVNNTANESGTSIFASLLYNCTWFPESAIQIPIGHTEAVYRHFFNFPEEKNESLAQIRSEPVYPRFCDKLSDVTQCLKPEITINKAFPGQTFQISVVPVDAIEQAVRSVVFSRIIVTPSEVNFSGRDQGATIASSLLGRNCSSVDHTLTSSSEENVTVEIELSLPGGVSVITAHVNLHRCPTGFELDRNTGECDCTSIYAQQNFMCDIETGLIQRTEGGKWIGVITNLDSTREAARSSSCPQSYCISDDAKAVDLSQEDFLCRGERTGELCGRCRNGFSLKFGTRNCGRCSNYWLFTIILYALAGIALVVILFVLRMTVTTGTINGLIFYAQVVGVNSGLLFRSGNNQFFLVFISLLNLDLGFPICFYDGMDRIAKTGLQFVFPIYIWFLMFCIIILSRFSPAVQKLTAHASVQVLDTLLFLSYAKLLTTVATIFIPAVIISESNRYRVWFFDGTSLYVRGRHLILAVAGFVTLVMYLAPYKISLLLAQWCLRNRKVSYYKPLIDANLAPYKDRWRFWFSLRLFLVTAMIVITVTLVAEAPLLTLHAHVILTLVFAFFQAYIKPYRSDTINKLDLFFMGNFCVLASISAYVLTLGPAIGGLQGPISSDVQTGLLKTAVGIFVGSAFLVFCGIVIYHIRQVTKPYTPMLKVWAREGMKRVTPSAPVKQPTRTVVTLDASSLFNHEDEERETVIRLRESLLEDSWGESQN